MEHDKWDKENDLPSSSERIVDLHPGKWHLLCVYEANLERNECRLQHLYHELPTVLLANQKLPKALTPVEGTS